MKQVFRDSLGVIVVEDVPAPAIDDGQVLVRVERSLISSGTELAGTVAGGSAPSLLRRAVRRPDKVVKGLRMVLSQGVGQTAAALQATSSALWPQGYSATGTIVRAGDSVQDLRPGDRVACAGAGFACHAEFIAVPRNLVVKVPDGISAREAAFTSVGAIAVQGVRRAGAAFGEQVVVVGLGLVGLLAAQIAHAAGTRVFGLDLSQERVEAALGLGIEAAAALGPDTEEQVLGWTEGRGADAVLLCAGTASSEPVNSAFRLARERGRIVVVGDIGLQLERAVFYRREQDLLISRSLGPGRYDAEYENEGLDYPYGYVRWTENRNMQEFLRLVAARLVRTEPLIGAEVEIAQAPAAFERLRSAEHPPVAALLCYPETGDAAVVARAAGVVELRHAEGRTGGIGLGVLGLGAFLQGVHLPNLAAMEGVRLQALASGRGYPAKALAKRYHVPYCTSDYTRVLHDPAVDAVVIGTRHSSHGRLAREAALAGKHVFVEKPLGLTVAECDAVIEAAAQSGVHVAVGFNRRFAPLAVEARRILQRLPGPAMLLYRVNAGPVQPGAWFGQRAEGGRVLGEVCHFFDLACWLLDEEPLELCSAAPDSRLLAGTEQRHIPGADATLLDSNSITIVMRMSAGSTVTLCYSSHGSADFPKERIEVFAHGGVICLDDFKTLSLSGAAARGREPLITGPGDKGHLATMRNFVDVVRGKAAPGVTAQDGQRATRWLLDALQLAGS